MTKRAIVPGEMKSFIRDWQMSPGVTANGFLFLSGLNGVPLQGGPISEQPSVQIETAFTQVGMVLANAGLSFDDTNMSVRRRKIRVSDGWIH